MNKPEIIGWRVAPCGPGLTQGRTGTANRDLVLTWNEKARQDRMWREAARSEFVADPLPPWERPRILLAPSVDVFDSRPELDAVRQVLWALIEHCNELDWILVTKQPDKVRRMVPAWWLVTIGESIMFRGWPRHLWIGTTVENQAMAEERIPHLLRIPAAVRFLSVEPLLGPVDIAAYTHAESTRNHADCECDGEDAPCEACDSDGPPMALDWVIVGGESGPSARPMHPNWVRDIRDQCQAASVPFLFKQWGQWCEAGGVGIGGAPFDMRRLSEAGQPGGYKRHAWPCGRVSLSVGKKAAGRILDGRTWDELPRVT